MNTKTSLFMLTFSLALGSVAVATTTTDALKKGVGAAGEKVGEKLEEGKTPTVTEVEAAGVLAAVGTFVKAIPGKLWVVVNPMTYVNLAADGVAKVGDMIEAVRKDGVSQSAKNVGSAMQENPKTTIAVGLIGAAAIAEWHNRAVSRNVVKAWNYVFGADEESDVEEEESIDRVIVYPL